MSNLSNGSWDNINNLKDISKVYYEGFLKYKEVSKKFKDIVNVVNYINELVNLLNIYNNNAYNNSDHNLFLDEESRFSIVRFNYLFLLCLILEGESNKIIGNDFTETNKNIEKPKTNSKGSSSLQKQDNVTLEGNELTFSSKLDAKMKDLENIQSGGYNNNNENKSRIETNLNKAIDDIDVEMYPEIIVSENYTNEPGEDMEDEADDLIDMIEDTLENKKNKLVVMKQFITDIFKYLIDLQKTYSSLNTNTVNEEISKGRNAIIKENLRINRDLSAEGMEDTRKMVNNLRMLGRLDYTNMMDNYDNIMLGTEEMTEADYEDTENAIPRKEIKDGGDHELFAKDDIYGNDEAFYEEDVFVGDAEDMEGGDFDYGYLGVD